MASRAPLEAATREPAAGGGPRVLVVTNDFPPRVGGVQRYVSNLVERLPTDRVAVLAPNWPGWREHDAERPYPIHRWPARALWPTVDLARRIRSLVRAHRSDLVLFGHGLLPAVGPDLAAAGVPYAALTHGWEVWLARTPGVAGRMRRGLAGARAVTAVSEYTERSIRRALGLPTPFHVLYPGVDPDRFSPDVDGGPVRARYGLDGKKIVLCLSRLVPRKGQDTLIAGLPLLRTLLDGATLVLVGDGPYRSRLEALAAGLGSAVVFAGEVPDEELPAHYAACDAFAMPCRSRWGGLEVEGFGIVYLEAGAAGKPVVAGRSGGAAEAVVDLETGLLTEGGEPKAVALTVLKVLDDARLASRLGAAARARILEEFTWSRQAARLEELLSRAVS